MPMFPSLGTQNGAVKGFIMVRNDTASVLEDGMVVKFETTNFSDGVSVEATNTDDTGHLVAGVVKTDNRVRLSPTTWGRGIGPNGEYGLCQVWGFITGIRRDTGTSVTVGTHFYRAADDSRDSAAAGLCQAQSFAVGAATAYRIGDLLGWALEADSAAAVETGGVFLRCMTLVE